MTGRARAAIDWTRMAEPQSDQYDTQRVQALTAPRAAPVPRPVARAGPRSPRPGWVRYRDTPEMGPPRFDHAPLDHPNLGQAVGYLRCWPAGYAQFAALIDTVHPCLDAQLRPEYRAISTGSSSYADPRRLGTVWVTVDHPVGCAQGLVRELARQKLYALGIGPAQARRLIANNPAAVYPSPIHRQPAQPLTALFHEDYALLYVTELDICMLTLEHEWRRQDEILQLLLRNVVRLEAYHAVVMRHIVPDGEGALFFAALHTWAGQAIMQAHRLLDANGYELHPVRQLRPEVL